jgi:glycosyltransferase involved in cell wall biosynthesis
MSKVFIGLPVYDGETYLAGALESLLAQTFGDFTVLVSDNASVDATGEIGRAFAARDPRVIYHRHATNLGAAPNFNFCLERANGTFFKWMAHDDVCEPAYLERCVAFLDADPGAVLCHARVRHIDAEGRAGDVYKREWTFNDPDPVVRFARAMALDHSCVTVFGVIRLETLRRTAAIAPFVGSDRPLLAELALYGRLEYVPEELFLWRDHPDRSVKLLDRRARLAWFDAEANGIWASRYARQLFANQKAALTVPSGLRAKSRAFGRTLGWAFRNRVFLFRDLRAVARAAVQTFTSGGNGAAAERQR